MPELWWTLSFKFSTPHVQLRDALVHFRLSPFTSFKCVTKDDWRGRSDIASIFPRHPQISITALNALNHRDHKIAEFDNTILLQRRWGPLARVNLCSKIKKYIFCTIIILPKSHTTLLSISTYRPRFSCKLCDWRWLESGHVEKSDRA